MASSSRIAFATCLVLIACCLNVVSLELIIQRSKQAGALVTLLQFVLIASHGFVFTARFGRKKSVVPLWEYAIIVILFFLSSLSSNVALGCGISMPVHMIFKSGSLLASLALGVIILKKSYSVTKYVSVAMISIGIMICTLISAGPPAEEEVTRQSVDLAKWLWGIFLLAAGLIMAARLGIYQEQIAAKYGKHPQEMLFYSHLLSLPAFVIFSGDIKPQFLIFNESEPWVVPEIGLAIPILWLYTIANVFTQYICIRSVYFLTTEMTSLSVTLVVTLRKFLSLLVSIYYFQNPFTSYHWLGTALVFGGSLIFADVFAFVSAWLRPSSSIGTTSRETKKLN